MTDIVNTINTDDQFITELTNAIKRQSFDEVKSIFDNYKNVQNIDINKQNENGFTIFMEATYFKNVKIIAFLYEKFKDKIDINIINKGGHTAFMIAANNPNVEVITFLYEKFKNQINK